MVNYFPPGTYRLTPTSDFASSVSRGALYDTNIMIDFLKGNLDARDAFNAYAELFTSVVCYMEVMIGCTTEEETTRAESMFSNFKILPILSPIEDIAIALRKHKLSKKSTGGFFKLLLPDSLIHATAIANILPIVTNNMKNFNAPPESVLQPFHLVNVPIDISY